MTTFPVFNKNFFLKSFVKYLIWDFDGTLYQDNNKLGIKLKQAFYNLSKSKNSHLTINKFDVVCQKLGSWSAASSYFTNVNEIELLDQIDKKIKKKHYIKGNPTIVDFIQKNQKFHHLILTNSTSQEVLECLPTIGFSRNPFEKIFSRDITNLLKPNPLIFSQIISYTKSPKFRHICIGDSQSCDIEPAKKFGFKAIPIWEIDQIIS